MSEEGKIIKNKDRLVIKGYNQEFGVDFEESFAPITRLETVRILLAFACSYKFKLFQMDAKTIFLNRIIKEEVYLSQPPGFEVVEKPNHVYKLHKVVYSLKQAPRA